MKIAIACDHAGFPLKETIIAQVLSLGHEIIDLGTDSDKPVDYPDYSEKLGLAILQGKAERGILLCGSGVGASIAANKMKGIYASVCHETYSARQGVEHDDMNVICIGSRVIGPEIARDVVEAFLAARFIGNDKGQERHARRVGKIRKMEES